MFPRRGIPISLPVLLALFGLLKVKKKKKKAFSPFQSSGLGENHYLDGLIYLVLGYVNSYVCLRKLGVLDMDKDE